MAINKEEADVDRGYAWVILAGCYMMYVTIVGSCKSYGILFTEIDEYYDVGAGPVSIVGSLLFFFMFAIGPFANYLALKSSFRSVALAGGLLLGIGYSATFFVVRLELFFLTIGVFGGLGYGLTFTPCSTIISFYFEKRRALANGITVSGSGIGSIAFSFFYKFLMEEYALKPALLIIGGVLFNVCVAACLFRQPYFLLQQEKNEDSDRKRNTNPEISEKLLNGKLDPENKEERAAKKRKQCTCGPDFKLSLLSNPRFTFYLIAFVTGVSGYGATLILIASQIKTLGFGKNSVSTAVAITGGSEIIARIFAGWLADRKWIRPKYIFLFNYLVSSVFTFITPHIHSLSYMYTYAAVVGLFPASFWSLVSVLVIDVVGMKNFAPAYGLVLLGIAVGLAVSQVGIAWVKDVTGDWKTSFYVTAVLLAIPAIMMLLETFIIPTTKILEEDTQSDNARKNIPENKIKNTISNEKDTEVPLLEDLETEKISHRSSRIYKAYKKESTRTIRLKEQSAPLATPEP